MGESVSIPLFLAAEAATLESAVALTAAETAAGFGGGGFFSTVDASIAQEIATRPLGTALSALGAGASLAGGFAGARGFGLEARQYREEAENARVAAEQEEAQRRRELARTLATQQAIRAGRGVELFSGTGLAIRDDTIHQAELDINTARLNALNRIRRFNLGASIADERASGAILGGVGGASTALLSGISDKSKPKSS